MLSTVAFLEGDLPEEFGDATRIVRGLVRHLGVPGSLALLYLEESGVPLPAPGDVYVLYLGHAAAGSLVKLGAALVGIVLVVVAGATNLYLVSRRWGEQLLHGRLGTLLHVTDARLAKTERWFERWGPLVVIFGRHVPGFRIPITVVAATFGVRYPVFAVSVAISTALWVTAWFIVEARFGREAGRFLSGHHWTYAVVAGIVALAIVSVVVRAATRRRSQADGAPTDR